MTIRAWRIIKPRYLAAPLSGEGDRRYGGRWNSPGRAAVYASENAALAVLEVLVHLRSKAIVQRYRLVEIRFEDRLVTAPDLKDFPKAWLRPGPSPQSQAFGDEWLAKAASAVLRLPSVIVPTEWNYLLNPAHPDFAKVEAGTRTTIRLDPRLVTAPIS